MSWFERTLQVSGYPIKKAEQDYVHLMALPEEQRFNWIQYQRKIILRHHLKNSIFYQSLVQNHLGDKDPKSAKALEALVLNGPESLSTPELELIWSRLPIMTKSDLQRPLSERYASGYGPRNTHKHKTSCRA